MTGGSPAGGSCGRWRAAPLPVSSCVRESREKAEKVIRDLGEISARLRGVNPVRGATLPAPYSTGCVRTGPSSLEAASISRMRASSGLACQGAADEVVRLRRFPHPLSFRLGFALRSHPRGFGVDPGLVLPVLRLLFRI